MRIVDIIEKKRDQKELTTEEIYFFVDAYQNDRIPDYQVSALLMAIYLNTMNERETADLAIAMAKSGDQIHYDNIPGRKVDKHSSGGVGDKTTLLLAPLVAACGLVMPKMSGRGLGFSGGTIDKLEAIAGFETELPEEEFVRLVNENGVAVIGQTKNIAPVDKKIYALRDVTATVENRSLIASSIMSKKLATATDAIVLDVKVGQGAFMKDLEQAIALAQSMCSIGESAGQDVTAIVSDMNQPLGYAVGNALEIKEVIATLKGDGPADLTELCYVLGSHMLVLGEVADTLEQARTLLQNALESGAAYEKFEVFIKAQGGDIAQIQNPELLPSAAAEGQVLASQDGYIENINAETIGQTSLIMGAGRNTKDDIPDPGAGVVLAHKVGDKVKKGDLLCTVYGNYEQQVEEGIRKAQSAFTIGDTQKALPLVYAVVTKEEVTYVD